MRFGTAAREAEAAIAKIEALRDIAFVPAMLLNAGRLCATEALRMASDAGAEDSWVEDYGDAKQRRLDSQLDEQFDALMQVAKAVLDLEHTFGYFGRVLDSAAAVA
jgi:hypothetical protein